MEADYTTTVAIVGAGPAGLVLAYLLRRAGVAFVLLERHAREELRSLPKAGAIEYRTVQLLTAEGIAGAVVTFDQENHHCEFRTPDERIVFDYGALTGSRPHFIYPQHELVGALCDVLVADGADMWFGACAVGAEQDAHGVTVGLTDASGRPSTIRAEVVVGCDGVRGPIAASMSATRVASESLPVRWLAVIGLAPPLEPRTIYAAHPNGFAGQMRRTPSITRYMLEVPTEDGVADWPEARIRAELSVRLDVGDRLADVALVEPSLVDLKMRMITPMQQGRVFLAGDAAHLITPAGGKGMNLAIQDAVELAHGLIDRFGPRQDEARLVGYSRTRLPAIWRTQAFSRWMLRLLLAGPGHDADDPFALFGQGLRQGWISALGHDPLLARWFAHAYAGVDPD